MISAQEEIVKIEMLQSETNWLVNDRIAYSNSLLIIIKVIPIEVLLKEKLDMEAPAILEKTMCNIRTHTITQQDTVNTLRRDKKQEINCKLEELNSILHDGDNEDEIKHLGKELKVITDEILQEQGTFFKNHELLNDCKITKDFIRLESRKGGYNNVVKLTIKDANNVITETITDPVEI